jgi:S-formylglutathione hydrolase FrmB
MRRRSWPVVLVGALASLALLVPGMGGPVRAAPADRLVLISTQTLSPRLSVLRVFSPALGRPAEVRVLTPAGFDPTRQHLPVLWLLHGGFGSSADWTTAGDAEALTAGLPMLVVMPDAGTGGWYADWQIATNEGPERWETFHLNELRPFIEARYRTRTDRGGRAVAGLSMGGFGAIHYAARHPDLFGFAAAFSGAVDILHPGVAAVVTISPLAHQGVPGDIFGPLPLDETKWRANNPVDLAANLRTVTVQLRTGNGMPGGRYPGGDPIQEAGVSEATATLHRRLVALGIPHLYDDYGPGTHEWPYWRDDLKATLPAIVSGFSAPPAPDPATVSYLAFEPAFAAWGFQVLLARAVYESALLDIRPDGFDLTGSGRGAVTTAARYRPGQTVRAAITGRGATKLDVVADGDGRVTVPVDLGPPNVVDEYPAAALIPARKSTVHVVLTPVP